MKGLRPGTYRVFAFEEAPAQEVLAGLAEHALSVRVQPGKAEKVILRRIAKGELP